ncbi:MULTISPECIES: ABC transporter substrate-binding protein [unclassified Paracoccus (in: a-proteobacteria)]|uniref:ABC transporter substrate-binding protein n=1 Tax=unclassified Paracoccus (in: a-proteobacteria) TaxID=2688777 RepID=UPI001FFDFE4F|nr:MULTISPECIES: ABC transporter substrate-binding protein [unclassified Paracoccus (in: a-proteobacteria)]
MNPILTAAALMLSVTPVLSQTWEETLDEARGQTVFFHAWGGDQRTNDFIASVGDEVLERHGVTLQHVRIADTADAVARVLAERAAGREKTGGSVDLIWLNGPNFLAMKDQGLLHGPFVANLPNAQWLDLSEGSANTVDFTVPVEGLESPWRLAKFVFNYDSARIAAPPADMAGWLDWAAAHPGRITHPDPANFMGATFLKQALIELAPDDTDLSVPPTDDSFAKATVPLWHWYDALRPNLWRDGRSFPENESIQQQLLNDGEIDMTMSFDPASAAAAIADGLLPETVRVHVPQAGSIGNVSFVAIPVNAAHKAGAKVVADALLAPATQARMQNIEVLGSFSVLDPAKLDATGQAAFAALPTAPALPALSDLGAVLAEPHPDWMTRLTAAWQDRYTR